MTGVGEPVAAYVAVGSNIDPRANVVRAVEALAREVALDAVSTFWRTDSIGPDGRPDGQADFVNGVVRVLARCDARTLKYGILRPIEARLGRAERALAARYAPRTIDLDLVIFGQAAIDEPGLRIPSPDVERPFVAACLLELAPELVLAGSGQALSCLWPGGGSRPGMTVEADLSARLKELAAK
jgi:2-amino-4-hydroxy-6-hydroxymethyldihydropteridine diphosphokinase